MRLICFLVFMGMVCVTPISSQIEPLDIISGEADPACKESSTATLLAMRKPPVTDTVADFWDLMIYLKSSNKSRLQTLYWKLEQLFWDIYMDCMLVKSHGMGRRQLVGEMSAAGLPSRKSLNCYVKNYIEDETVECPPGKDTCMIVKSDASERVYKACVSLEFCEKFPQRVTDVLEIHRCCHEDLCNA
uniref:PMF variant 2 n=1 Tax=Plethodon cinereus TaxID=141976 RepID=W8PWS3_9SALA|nr:PMF precursor variant 2 [Plethodon cinereus]AHL39275.1 PMF precursor variant 3 [Plethodon cinereus]